VIELRPSWLNGSAESALGTAAHVEIERRRQLLGSDRHVPVDRYLGLARLGLALLLCAGLSTFELP
jgi:hypothetical protein